MSDIAISAEKLGKRYRIGTAAERRDKLGDVLAHAFRAPLENLRRLSRAATPLEGESDDLVWALRDVSFEVKHGEIVGVIGRNGAGKSTLLKLLSRITEPSVGHAVINGRVGSLLEVGTGFHPELTGRENVFLNGSVLGMDRAYISRKFDEIVEFSGVERYIDTPVKRYSSGMYLRLAFAVAAHLEPEILIVDEVLAVGDMDFQKKCLGKMGEVAKGGRTVIFVSHSMGAVRSLCTRTLWIAGGGLRMDGPTIQVVDSYMQEALEPPDTSIDLADVQRPSMVGEQLRLLRVEFNGGEPILHGEPLSVKIDFATSGRVEDVSIGVGFCTIEGVRLMTLDSDLFNARRTVPGELQGSVTAVIPDFALQPGRYTLDVGARSGDTNALDYLPGCAQVEVLPGQRTPSSIIGLIGGVRMPARWDWQAGPGANVAAVGGGVG